MNSALLMPMIAGFATIIVGMLGLFYATLRSAAVTRRESRADFERLDSKIEAQGAWHDAKIEEQGSRLAARIEEQGARLDAKIEGQGNRLDAKTDDQVTRLDAKIDGLRTELRAEMERGFARMHSDYRDVRNRLDRLTDSLALRGLQLEPEEG